MRFEDNKAIEHIGVNIGFIFSYFLFTTIAYFLFLLLNKLHGLNYLHIMGITLVITCVGLLIKRFLQ